MSSWSDLVLWGVQLLTTASIFPESIGWLARLSTLTITLPIPFQAISRLGLFVGITSIVLALGALTPEGFSASNASHASSEITAPDPVLDTIPFPQSVNVGSAKLKLTPLLLAQTTNQELKPLSGVFAAEYQSLTGGKVVTHSSPSESSTIVQLALDHSLSEQTYRLVIDSKILITGASYAAVAMGTVTFLQLLEQENDGTFAVPQLIAIDSPTLPFRGLLVDVARNWHDVSTLEQLIELARWYKINYLQPPLTDNDLFTFPTAAFPELMTPEKHYTKEQLQKLVEYASVRGVTLIPELDVPGHSRLMVKRKADKFGFNSALKDPSIRAVSTINMGREAAYQALDKLVKEVAKIFCTGPYIHMGGDEAKLQPLASDPEVQRYMSVHKLDSVEELYRHFIVRMNEIVKRHGKQMMVWEGFRKEGRVEIPRDITVMEFETAYQLPSDLLAGGYQVINASWMPLYVVNEKKWEPDYIYNTWNPYRWENPFPQHPSFIPIQLEPAPQVKGAMMCAWEQAQEIELTSLRRRLAAMSERAWQGGLQPERSFVWFEGALAHTDKALEAVLTGAKSLKLSADSGDYMDYMLKSFIKRCAGCFQ